MKLSNITVSFKRTKQVQQFEPASAEVSLTYVSEDDEIVHGSAISTAMATAKLQVAEALGLKTVGPQIENAPGRIVVNPKIGENQADFDKRVYEHVKVEAVKTEANPTKSLSIASVVAVGVPATEENVVAEPKKRGRPKGSKNVDPAAMEDVVEIAVATTVAPPIASLPSDPAAMEDVSIPPTQTGTPTGSTVSYTAADLARAINARMTKMVQAKIVNPSDKIKAYIETWRPAGVTGPVSAIYQHVPKDKRAEFVAKLEEVV